MHIPTLLALSGTFILTSGSPTLAGRPLLAPRDPTHWQPQAGATWQIELSNVVTNTSWDRLAWDFDLFDNPVSIIDKLHSQGRKVICYYSAGSWEKWRPDASKFPPSVLGRPLDGWPGERWLNISSPIVRQLMVDRIELAQSKGCDAVDPDNVDGYQNNNGLGLTREDALSYVRFLTTEAQQRGMASGLKNAKGLVADVVQQVDFSVNEQCAKYKECQGWQAFITAGKPVFHIEYHQTVNPQIIQKACKAPGSQGFSTLIKHLDLGEWAVACP